MHCLRSIRIASRRKTVPSIDPHFAEFPFGVGHPRIRRFGVFALKSIPRGRKVIEYTGERLNPKQAKARQRDGGTKRAALIRLNRYCSTRSLDVSVFSV
jgi:hypothetical protein